MRVVAGMTAWKCMHACLLECSSPPLSALAGTAFGSLYGLAKGYAATPLAFQGGANAFVFAFPFFGGLPACGSLSHPTVLILSPHPQSSPRIRCVADAGKRLLRRKALHSHQERRRECHLRRHCGRWSVGLLSCVSSFVLPLQEDGTSQLIPSFPLSFSRAGGPQKLLPGLTTFAVLCSSMQLLGNELRVLRVHMLTERDEAPDAVGSATQTLPSLREAHAASLPVDAPPQPVEVAPSTDSDWLGWLGSYLVSLSPVRKVSDAEYQEQLQTRRRHVLEKLREVENGIAREEAAQKQV